MPFRRFLLRRGISPLRTRVMSHMGSIQRNLVVCKARMWPTDLKFKALFGLWFGISPPLRLQIFPSHHSFSEQGTVVAVPLLIFIGVYVLSYIHNIGQWHKSTTLLGEEIAKLTKGVCQLLIRVKGSYCPFALLCRRSQQNVVGLAVRLRVQSDGNIGFCLIMLERATSLGAIYLQGTLLCKRESLQPSSKKEEPWYCTKNVQLGYRAGAEPGHEFLKIAPMETGHKNVVCCIIVWWYPKTGKDTQ